MKKAVLCNIITFLVILISIKDLHIFAYFFAQAKMEISADF